MASDEQRYELDWTWGFSPYPREVEDAPAFRRADPMAIKLLHMLSFQYDGKNNGALIATLSEAKRWEINSQTTLAKHLKYLKYHGFIIQTRANDRGRNGARCGLYALAWLPIQSWNGEKLEQPLEARRSLQRREK